MGHTDAFLHAMRQAVEPQIIKFRSMAHIQEYPCSVCGFPVESSTNVDYDIPFTELLDSFLIENPDRDSPAFDLRWQKFHQKHAQLSFTHAVCSHRRKS